MIAEIGHFALILAFTIAFIQGFVPFLGVMKQNASWMKLADMTAHLQTICVTISFAALTYAYIVSDFSVINVFENSHTDKALLYKITGVWGNHEGSMLLWILILVLFGSAVAATRKDIPLRLKASVLSVQAWLTLCFLAFLLFTSNPFGRLNPVPQQGNDLNPLLQDIGLAIHPPLLYIGYVGLSISFSFAIAALIIGRIDSVWAKLVRPWTMISWIFLTAGISMGSYWAYYELGWGGWWFWDPVENASFMPWLVATALLHSVKVMEIRNAMKIWTILLAILAFSFSLLGTFLVRSGVLTSVHSFATDPTRGLFILLILMLFIGGAFLLFALRVNRLKHGGVFAPVSREGALVLNNVFLMTSCATVLIGTLYPLVLEALTNEKISVGEPYYHLTFVPLMIPLLLLMPIGPLLSWKRARLEGAIQRLWLVAAITLGCAFLLYMRTDYEAAFSSFGVGVAVWLMIGGFAEIFERARITRHDIKAGLKRSLSLPPSRWGTAFAHAGLGVSIIGMVMVSSFETETILNMKQGDEVQFAGYSIRYDSAARVDRDNFQAVEASFSVSSGGNMLTILKPEKRFYEARRTPTTESAIESFGFSQLYISLGDSSQKAGQVVRIYHKPYVTLIWIGTLIMMLGGAVAMVKRRQSEIHPKPQTA